MIYDFVMAIFIIIILVLSFALFAMIVLYRQLRYLALCGCVFHEEKNCLVVLVLNDSGKPTGKFQSIRQAYGKLKAPRKYKTIRPEDNDIKEESDILKYRFGSWK